MADFILSDTSAVWVDFALVNMYKSDGFAFPFAPITLKNSRLEIPTLEWNMLKVNMAKQ